MEVEVFTEESLFSSLGSNKKTALINLVNEFKSYKTNAGGNLLGISMGNSYFGKDEALTQPPFIRNILYKVHFKPDNPRRAIRDWNSVMQRGSIPTSNHILIYSQGSKDKNKYLLIDIFKPDGHEKIKDLPKLKELCVSFALPFREEY